MNTKVAPQEGWGWGGKGCRGVLGGEMNCDTASRHLSTHWRLTRSPSEPLNSPTGTAVQDDWPLFTVGENGFQTGPRACPKPHGSWSLLLRHGGPAQRRLN